MNGPNIGCSWSGGKDSCFALMQALKASGELRVLLNVMNEEGRISRSHGLPTQLLNAQAAAIGVPIVTIPSSWNEYERNFVNALHELKDVYNIEQMIFGDIDLQAHRDWEEMVCRKAGLEAKLPIWQQDRKELLIRMLDAGIETMIVSCNSTLGESFLGRILTRELIPELEEKGVDVCGENGEFHTLVLNCSLFSTPVLPPPFQPVKHNDYWFCNWSN